MAPLGITRANRPWVIVGVLLFTAVTGYLIWLGLQFNLGALSVTVTGYRVVDDRTVQVTYTLNRPADTAVVCTVVAQDAQHGRVGTLDDAVPAGPQTSVPREVTVRTSARAVTGLVQSCVRR